MRRWEAEVRVAANQVMDRAVAFSVASDSDVNAKQNVFSMIKPPPVLTIRLPRG